MTSLSLDAARRLAEERLSSQRAAEALQLAHGILASFPRDFRTRMLAAKAHLALGETDSAVELLQAAVRVDPQDREVRRLLGECGCSEHSAVLPDLPPLEPLDDERAPVSGVALGHLHLRQGLYAHAASQLEPLRADRPDRLDLALSLAEAYWQLEEPDKALAICAGIRESAPECLKANLIEGQIGFARGEKERAAPFLAAAEAVDPENLVADELFARLAATQPSAVPLRNQPIEVDIDLESIGSPEQAIVADLQDRETEEPRPAEPMAPRPVTEAFAGGRTTAEGFEERELRHEEPVLADSWSPSEAEPSHAPFRLEEQAATYQPSLPSETSLDRAWQPERLRPDALGVLASLDIGPAGEVVESTLDPARAGADAGHISRWSEAWREVSGRLDLGNLRYSIVQSSASAVHVLHHPHHTTVALTTSDANLGLVRLTLRRGQQQTVENAKE